MEEIAKQEKIDFILNTGANFYQPREGEQFDDHVWNTYWGNIYKDHRNLEPLVWYGVIGTHDYNNKRLDGYFLYKQNGW